MRAQRRTYQSGETGAVGIQMLRRGALLFFMLASSVVFISVFLAAL